LPAADLYSFEHNFFSECELIGLCYRNRCSCSGSTIKTQEESNRREENCIGSIVRTDPDYGYGSCGFPSAGCDSHRSTGSHC
jgi:hypothetical protein